MCVCVFDKLSLKYIDDRNSWVPWTNKKAHGQEGIMSETFSLTSHKTRSSHLKKKTCTDKKNSHEGMG